MLWTRVLAALVDLAGQCLEQGSVFHKSLVARLSLLKILLDLFLRVFLRILRVDRLDGDAFSQGQSKFTLAVA